MPASARNMACRPRPVGKAAPDLCFDRRHSDRSPGHVHRASAGAGGLSERTRPGALLRGELQSATPGELWQGLG